ncbi:hypothetical protein Cgig2_002286 [Carnegiea gigantea]|uniref:Uncharacterized protein n=1 Tax=Carnegiea gigantea TaxID=171969 RepID=A0A9Q1QPL9_9CARY|nr:hypothetical protein Cgig2_002286 [Carnegiea gigantea]
MADDQKGHQLVQSERPKHIRLHKCQIVALLETHISGDRAEENSLDIEIEIIFSHGQFITMWITQGCEVHRILTTLGATVQNLWLLLGDFNDTVSLRKRNNGEIEMLRHYEDENWVTDPEQVSNMDGSHLFSLLCVLFRLMRYKMLDYLDQRMTREERIWNEKSISLLGRLSRSRERRVGLAFQLCGPSMQPT